MRLSSDSEWLMNEELIDKCSIIIGASAAIGVFAVFAMFAVTAAIGVFA